MSNNSKNTIGNAYLKNFTKKVKNRYVLLEKGNRVIKNIPVRFKRINAEVNRIIQDLNIKVTERQLPYINLNCYYGNLLEGDSQKCKRVRMFVQNGSTNSFLEYEVQEYVENNNTISHILNIYIVDEGKTITISDLSCDAQVVIDESDFENAMVDILLDIIMFNSYSFLKEMNIHDKRLFSKQKYDFFIDESLSCYYNCTKDELVYYCLAFSARKGNQAFDEDKFIMLWEKLINKYYPGKKHVEKSIIDQLKQHVDYGQLPANLSRRLSQKTKGSYLVLKINTDRSKELHPMLFSLFGIKKINKKKVLIKPISEIDEFKPLLKNLDVSAFKVVVS